MAVVTQNQTDSFNMSSGMSVGIQHSETSTFNVMDVATPARVVTLTSTANFAGVATNTVAHVESVASQMAWASAVTPALLASISSTFNMMDVVTPNRVAELVSSFNMMDVATPGVARFANLSSSFNVMDSVLPALLHSETSSFNMQSAIAVGIDVALVSSFNFMDAVTPSNHPTVSLASSFTFTDSTSSKLAALTSVTSSANFRSAASPVDPLGQSYWSNAEKMAAAVWQQTPYESYALHEGELIAAGASGIYQFGSDTDGGNPINASITSDNEDFDTAKRKCFEAVYVSGQTGTPLLVTVTTELGAYTYETHVTGDTSRRVHRAPVGRGLIGNYVRVTVRNQNGAAFGINGVQIRAGETARTR